MVIFSPLIRHFYECLVQETPKNKNKKHIIYPVLNNFNKRLDVYRKTNKNTPSVSA